MRKCMTIGVALFTLAFVGGAVAADKPSFDDLDKDGDGAVSVEQAVEAGIPRKEAEKEDFNNDGKLSEEDWKFVQMKPPKRQQQGSGAGSGAGPGGARPPQGQHQGPGGA